MDKVKEEEIIQKITDSFMSVGLPDVLITDSSGKPHERNGEKIDNDFLEQIRSELAPSLDELRKTDDDFDDWYLVREWFHQDSAQKNGQKLKKQWLELKTVLDNSDEISISNLFFSLQKKAVDKLGLFESLAITIDPNVLLDHGVPDDLVSKVSILHNSLRAEHPSKGGKKGGTRQTDKQAKNEEIHIHCFKLWLDEPDTYKNLADYYHVMTSKTGATEKTIRRHLKKHGLKN